MTTIVGAFPTTIQNGQVEDATVVMALFAYIQTQVNGNACPATTGSAILKGDGAGGTTTAVSGSDYLPGVSGMLFDFAGTSVPAGYLACDGSAVSRATYAALFTAIGTTWGVGDGSTTFNVPDFRRRATIGAGGAASAGPANTVGATGGAETHVISAGELPTHNHVINISDPTHFHGLVDPSHTHTYATGGIGGAGFPVMSNGNGGNTAIAAAVTGISMNPASTGISATSNNAGSSTAMALFQPTAVVTKIIKT